MSASTGTRENATGSHEPSISTVPEENEEDEAAVPTIDEENANVSQLSHASSFELDSYKASSLSPYTPYRLHID